MPHASPFDDTWHLDDFQLPGESWMSYVLRSLGKPDATPPKPIAVTPDAARAIVNKVAVDLETAINTATQIIEYIEEERVYFPVHVKAILDVFDKALDALGGERAASVFTFAVDASDYLFHNPYIRKRLNYN